MDAWPETFYRLLPKSVRFLGAMPLLPLRAAANRAYRGADIVTGVCDAYGEIALAHGAKSYHRFYHGVSTPAKREPSTASQPRLSFVYAGNFGKGYDLTTAIRAVRDTDGATLDIAGAGPREAEWRACAAHSPRIRFHGYLAERELAALMESAHRSAANAPRFSKDTARARRTIRQTRRRSSPPRRRRWSPSPTSTDSSRSSTQGGYTPSTSSSLLTRLRSSRPCR